MATITTPPARRTVRQFNIVEVRLRAGDLEFLTQCLDSSGDLVEVVSCSVQASTARGVRYRADGGIEAFSIIDPNHAATSPVNAYNAFVNAAGGFAAKAAALEAWAQSVGLLPT
jgi:hypothetical protein